MIIFFFFFPISVGLFSKRLEGINMIRHFPLLAGIVGRVIISVVVEPEAVLKRVPVNVVQVTVLPLVTSVDDVIGNRCCWPSPGLC